MLHAACSCGKIGIMKDLIDKGANVNAVTITNCTPLHHAMIWYSNNLNLPNSFQTCKDMCKILISAGCNHRVINDVSKKHAIK